MIRATATFAATPRVAAAAPVHPVVFVDGRPEPCLRVMRVESEMPLGLIDVFLRLDVRDQTDRLLGSTATVALPRTLTDRTTRWDVLAVGRLNRIRQHSSVGNASQELGLVDRWQALLDSPPGYIVTRLANGELVNATHGQLDVGDRANRSAVPVRLGDRDRFVPQADGQPWTLRQALDTLGGFFQLQLATDSLPQTLARLPLSEPVPLEAPLGPALRRLLDEHGLMIERTFSLHHGQPRESRRVRPVEAGPRVHLPGPPRPATVRLEAEADPPAARRWVVHGQRPLVESTFELRPGWDPELQGQSDSDYDRTLSPDFSRYGNVFRRWMLNEDGHLPDQPVFDPATFFSQPELRSMPLRFEDNLTRDDVGRRLGPILETSRDAGLTWSRTAELWQMLNRPAGIRFEGDALGDDTLAAAQAGQLRVRLTAALRSPRPHTARRWRGNPFGQVGSERVFDFPDRFRFQRVDARSIHRPALAAGTLTAHEYDDTTALDLWLIRRLDREDRLPQASTGRARVTLQEARPEYRPGDRVAAFDSSAGRFLDHVPSQEPRPATVVRVGCDFGDSPRTELTLHF